MLTGSVSSMIIAYDGNFKVYLNIIFDFLTIAVINYCNLQINFGLHILIIKRKFNTLIEHLKFVNDKRSI